MDFTYKVEDIRLIYAFHAFACILVDKKLCTQRCTPKSGGAANFSFYPEVLRCRDHIKLEMNQIVCWEPDNMRCKRESQGSGWRKKWRIAPTSALRVNLTKCLRTLRARRAKGSGQRFRGAIARRCLAHCREAAALRCCPPSCRSTGA